MKVRDGIHSSPFNFLPEVVEGDRLPRQVMIQDVTLREGEQAAEIAFGLDDRVEIARHLEAVGVHQIQVGYAGDEDDAVAAIKRAGVRTRLALNLVGFKPDWERRLKSARDAGADTVQVLYRSADAQLAEMGISREHALARVVEVVGKARSLGFDRVQFEPSFVTRADWSFLETLYRSAVGAGAQWVSMCDSMGVARPSAVRHLISRISDVAGVPVQVHCHNDFGLAVANSLAGLEGGGTGVDVAVAGLGERAGGASLDEVVLALEGLYGVKTGIRLDALFELSKLIERITQVPIPPMKPIVGANCFAQKLDIHVMLTAKKPWLLEPYDPSLVGNRRELRLGRGSGPLAVRAKLQELGLQLAEDRFAPLVERINREAIEQRACVSDEQFREMVRTA